MSAAAKPPSGRRMKARAPPPPPAAPQPAPLPAPRHIFRNVAPDGGGVSDADAKENLLRPSVDLQLTLPQGQRTAVTADGSKALMDLLVELCSCHHLNPALHTLELLSPEGHLLGFKPNVLLGSLDVACVLIKEKVWEEKVARRPAPKVPEKTVRLMVNYHGSQKAVVRVNPLAPLQALIPVVCDKCELDPAHVLLLKDGVGRQKLPLDKSLSELGIKELYVLDQRLVLQPKMASAPALNLSDSICSSTNSLARAEKKGLLGLFPFSRRKSKTETLVMDDSDDKVLHYADTHSNGPSTAACSIEERPSTLGQSQSVGNVSRLSPKFDTKKRRAPAPPPGTGTGTETGTETPNAGQISLESFQLGSESQQRKRKAPAPPPTPDTSSSAETPTPVLRSKMAESLAMSSTTAAMREAVRPPLSVPPAPAPAATATAPVLARRSPTPSSSSTSDSLAVQDSSSELSHSLDDSDLEAEQSGSRCSTLTSSSASGAAAARLNPDATSGSTSGSDSSSALNLKVEDVENNRHSAMGTSDQAAPPKPRRAPACEQPPQQQQQQQPPTLPPTPPTPPPSSPSIQPTESSSAQRGEEVEEAAPQSWLHSAQRSSDRPSAPEAETPEAETLSLGSSSSSSSSSGGSSQLDQGYAASEGTAEGEDSGLLSSPSDTQPTSPDGSLSLDRGGGSGSREGPPGPMRDNSSDSDEGCATWGSRRRHSDIKPQSGRMKDTYGEDPELSAQLQQTLAKFEADLADRMDSVSEKSCVSSDIHEVPVSVVDMDVPVTAIDEVLEDYGLSVVEHEAESLTRSESADRKGAEAAAELQNKNNNACTTANNGSSSGKAKEQRGSLERKTSADQRQEKPAEADREEGSRVRAEVRKQKPDPARSGAHRLQTDKKVPAALSPTSPSTDRDETPRVHLPPPSSAASHSKITTNVTSRFGLKTFTVVPPKPAVLPPAAAEPAGTLSAGAIKIDEQGNMVKAGFQWNKAGSASEPGADSSEGAALVGRAKAFWSSNERQESAAPPSRAPADGAKHGAAERGSHHRPEATADREDLRTSQSAPHPPAERVGPRAGIRPELREPLKLSKEEPLDKPPSLKPAALPKPLPSDMKRELPFLKPSRRTSSQYVASAITKYTPKTPTKPASTPHAPEPAAFLKKQSGGFQRSVKPGQSSSDSSEKDPGSDRPGPRKSADSAGCVSQRQRRGADEDSAPFGNCLGASKGSFNTPETTTAQRELIPPTGPSHVNGNAADVTDHSERVRLGHAPSRAAPPPSSAKPPAASETGTREQTSVTGSLAPDAKPQPSVTASSGGAVPAPPPVTLFGPVQKFRPVICRSVEKETSLHSSLMEAIQTGGGRERLRKISSSGANIGTKTSYVEEENDRSALLAAIRAQNNGGRLKKIKSEAADELELFRKSPSEDPRRDLPSPSPSPLISPLPPVFTAPPPPPPMAPPPPPPATALQGKPAAGGRPSADATMNAALAREAMMEAIRSGSAAEKLKKVAPPTKTLQVNGRLGTMRATSVTPAAAALPQL